MRPTTYFAIFIIVLALSSCEITKDGTSAKRGEARIVLFKECMELASKLPRQADDDVSDVVDSCSNQSAYMTNFL